MNYGKRPFSFNQESLNILLRYLLAESGNMVIILAGLSISRANLREAQMAAPLEPPARMASVSAIFLVISKAVLSVIW
jgi:hypothetical protein